MKSPIELRKTYQLHPNYNTIQTNHREHVLLLYTLHELTGLLGSELIENYLNLIIPINVKIGEKGYNFITSHRSKRRKHLNNLIENYLISN